MERCLRAYYSGMVQGIGFRFTAERLASGLGLKGWVKNLRDGRVEIVCEGAESRLRDFLAKIEEIFKGYIRDSDIVWNEPSGELENFDIKF